MAPQSRRDRVLLWDFDGTLGYRVGGAWAATLLEVALRRAPESGLSLEDMRPTTQAGFPWHEPEQPHPQLATAEAWWAALEAGVLSRAFREVGFAEDTAKAMADQVRPTYLARERWRLFDDTIPTLERLSAQGWRHILLTNHVPELPDILAYLGVARQFVRVYNSAQTGYEKPHPRAFEMVIEALGGERPARMIGDSYAADICGAAALGIPGILVRRPHPEASTYAGSLLDVPELIEATQSLKESAL